MATAPEWSLALDDELYLSGVERSMTCNAILYQRDLAAGVAVQQVTLTAQADQTQYQSLLSTRDAVRADAVQGPMLVNGLTAAGINPQAQSLRLATLKAKANQPVVITPPVVVP